MNKSLPEKARVLEQIRKGGFEVPDFIFVPASDFANENFAELEAFLKNHRESFKVIARSAHPQEEFYKGGTFDSLETYADLSGIKYARKRMVTFAETSKKLAIRRQQKFNNAPEVAIEEMGVIVMPFISGSSVMAKMLWDHWEFGYCRDRLHKIQSEPYITRTPHDRKLLEISQKIQDHLGFPCEIEFIISEDGKIHVVQAKDIGSIDILEKKEGERSITLDGVRRIRKRRNYRERPVYVMDNKNFYLKIINRCEDMTIGANCELTDISDILDLVSAYEEELETFALRHQRFCILGLSIHDPEELFQIANHYLDETPDLQEKLSRALHSNLYKIDIFLSEADTLVAKDKFRVNLCGHDAYGIDTVRNPLWTVYWTTHKHEAVVKEFRRIGFKTGDSVGIDVNNAGCPTVIRL
ncbi:MAG: hypothetical protein JRI93_06465 [Deltaproteobacteria bacterium]|nr:hypothetical protein [Deltaproteobacteria bacterium]